MRTKSISILLIVFLIIPIIRKNLPVINFHLNRDSIIANYCVNKADVEKHCDGKCYLAKEIEKLGYELSKDVKRFTTFSESIDEFVLIFNSNLYPNKAVKVRIAEIQFAENQHRCTVFKPPRFT